MKNIILALLIAMTSMACSSGYKRSNISDPRDGDLSYRDLMLKDYDDMSKAVRKQIKLAQQEIRENGDDDFDSSNGGFIELKRALRLVFSRPNSDNMIAKLVPEVRRELSVYDAYPDVITDLAKEGVRAFDKNLGVATTTLATYTFMLENLMVEVQGEAKNNPELRSAIQLIADAKLVIPDDVVRERKLSGMFLSRSPSETAKLILKRLGPPQN